MKQPVDAQKLKIWKRAKELADGDQRIALPIARLAFKRGVSLEGALRCPTCKTVIESASGRLMPHECAHSQQLKMTV